MKLPLSRPQPLPPALKNPTQTKKGPELIPGNIHPEPLRVSEYV